MYFTLDRQLGRVLNRFGRGRSGLRVNRAFARGFLGAFTNTGRPDLNGRPPTSNSATPKGGAAGLGYAYSGTAQTSFPNGTIKSPSTNGVSVFAYLDVDSLSNYSHVIEYANTPGGAGWELRLGAGPSDSRLAFVRGTVSGVFVTSTASGSDTFSAPSKGLRVVVSATGDFAIAPRFCVNGTFYTGSGTGSGALDPSTGPINIGRRSDGVTQLAGTIYCIAVWERVLLDGEALALSIDAWALFEPEPLAIWVDTAAGSAAASLPPYSPIKAMQHLLVR